MANQNNSIDRYTFYTYFSQLKKWMEVNHEHNRFMDTFDGFIEGGKSGVPGVLNHKFHHAACFVLQDNVPHTLSYFTKKLDEEETETKHKLDNSLALKISWNLGFGYFFKTLKKIIKAKFNFNFNSRDNHDEVVKNSVSFSSNYDGVDFEVKDFLKAENHKERELDLDKFHDAKDTGFTIKSGDKAETIVHTEDKDNDLFFDAQSFPREADFDLEKQKAIMDDTKRRNNLNR